MTRIETLIQDMSLAEKLGQLTMTAAGHAVTGPFIAGHSTDAIRDGTIGNLLNLIGADHVREMQRIAVEESRLKIPLLIGLDVIHGHRTIFPMPLAEAGLFDPTAWERTAREAAIEASADGLAMTFSPMLDVSRDPRWGRGVEGPGEDPWLAAQIARAKVRGYQGTEWAAADSIAAVAKHYCGYAPVTAGREYAAVDISERTLHEVHLPPFAAAVAAGVAAIMPAFTDLAGVPLTIHVPLLRDWLRGRLRFDGVIVSDYNAIGELIAHGVAADLTEAAVLALKAGVDIDMMADAYRQGLPTALERGWVSMAEIDTAVRRVLTLKARLGLFEDPYRRGRQRESATAVAARRQYARVVAARSAVLLTNRNRALPLPPALRRLAVIGPLADAAREMQGCWAAAAGAEGHVSVLAGLRDALPGVELLHAAGVSISGDAVGGIDAALNVCRGADAVVLCVGEAAAMSGEAASRAHLGLPGQQRALAEAVLQLAAQRSISVSVVLFSGRPLSLSWLFERADAVLAAWFLGSEAGHAIADLLTGRVDPSGRTAVSWPRTEGQIPVYFGERPTGRPAKANDHYTSKYLDVANDPQFAFGHGLSYTSFSLTDLRVTPTQLRADGELNVEVTVRNDGDRAGEETLFLFTRDRVASVTRPLLELKGFTKVTLQPGERTTVRLRLPAAELKFLGFDLEPIWEAGQVEIGVGPCADRSRLLVSHVDLLANDS